jgi:hypothetical protein
MQRAHIWTSSELSLPEVGVVPEGVVQRAVDDEGEMESGESDML